MEKYVYIKRSIAKTYVDFAEPLNPDEYNNIGETYEDYMDNLWVLLSDEQVAFHEAHPTASVKEVWDMEITPAPIHVRTLEDAKYEKLQAIDSYDKSSSVNEFTINGEQTGWFTPDERSNYRSSIDAAKLVGLETLSFFVGDMLLTVTPTQAEYMLAQVQLYADQCYIVTQQHRMAVRGLETIEAVDAFDITAGYPEKINFTYPIEVA